MESNFCAGCRFYDPCKMYCHLFLTGIEDIRRCMRSREFVEVVRCKDCIHWNSGTNDAESWEYCTLLNHNMGGDMFCSCGERKVDDNG